MIGSPGKPSSAFSSRELNGEVLLDALNHLRENQVQTRHLYDLSLALLTLQGMNAAAAQSQLRSWAQGRFAQPDALGSFLSHWAGRFRNEADVPVFVLFVRRMLLVGAAINGLRRAAHRLPQKVPV